MGSGYIFLIMIFCKIEVNIYSVWWGDEVC